MNSFSGTALDGEIHSHNRYLIVGNRRNRWGAAGMDPSFASNGVEDCFLKNSLQNQRF